MHASSAHLASAAPARVNQLLTLPRFLHNNSYHKERPVFLTMAVMLAHTACFYLILNLPIDTMLKVGQRNLGKEVSAC